MSSRAPITFLALLLLASVALPVVAADNSAVACKTPVLKSECFERVRIIPRANPADLHGWKLLAHVRLESDIASKTAKLGDTVWGVLTEDCLWGSKLVASKDSIVRGHIASIEQARTLLNSCFSNKRRWHTGAVVQLVFDEIIDQDNRSWKIEGKLCRSTQISTTLGQNPRILKVDRDGCSVESGQCLTEKQRDIFFVARVASYAPIPVPGPMAIGMLAAPVAMGIAGAAYPAFAYGKPVNMEQNHVREKAFAYGFVTHLPGAGLVSACVKKGKQIDMKAGDQFVIDMRFK